MLKRNTAIVALSSLLGSFAWGFQSPEEAIRSQAGCYKVAFSFVEKSASTDDDSAQDERNYNEGVTEWVKVVEDSPGKISLVHVLVASSGRLVMKHWRQTWTKNPTSIWEFKPEMKPFYWEKRQLDPEAMKDRWSQTIYQINDAPNRACLGTWENSSIWTCTATAPITRRDWKRGSAIDFYEYNYKNTYDQNSFYIGGKLDKFKNNQMISTEEGGGLYEKLDEEECRAAIDWWGRNEPTWTQLSNAWENIYQSSNSLQLNPATVNKWKTHWKKLYNEATPHDNVLSWAATRDWGSWLNWGDWMEWLGEDVNTEPQWDRMIREDWTVL